jgi:hypothetical protein
MAEETSWKLAWEVDGLSETSCGSRSFLYEAIAEGRLKAIKRGHRTVILAPDLRAWMKCWPATVIRPRSTPRR